jgi:hypothetical protein
MFEKNFLQAGERGELDGYIRNLLVVMDKPQSNILSSDSSYNLLILFQYINLLC